MPADDLKRFIVEAGSGSHLRVEDDLGDGFVRLLAAEAERRQAKHDIRGTEDIVIEMLRNARDAGARNIFCATWRDGVKRHLVMIDDGCGIPEHLTERIFEARVTSKLDTMHFDTWGVHGRGMALFAIKENAQNAYVTATKTNGGSAFYVVADTTVLPEKRDQSSQPVFSLSEAGTVVVRGPRNINRTVAEFAYIDRENCTVYYGSPVEIAACLWEFGKQAVSGSVRAFCRDPEELSVCKRLSIAHTPDEFAQIATTLGLAISERSARRIMDGQIRVPDPVAEGIDPYSGAQEQHGEKRPDPHAVARGKALRDKRGLKIAPDDLESFAKHVARAYKDLARDYYLDPDIVPQIKVGRDQIKVTIPLRKDL